MKSFALIIIFLISCPLASFATSAFSVANSRAYACGNYSDSTNVKSCVELLCRKDNITCEDITVFDRTCAAVALNGPETRYFYSTRPVRESAVNSALNACISYGNVGCRIIYNYCD